MRFILYSMIVDAIDNFLAHRCALQFRFDRRIDGLFAKQPMLGSLVGKLFAVFPSEVFQLKGSGTMARGGDDRSTGLRKASSLG